MNRSSITHSAAAAPLAVGGAARAVAHPSRSVGGRV